MGAPQYEQAGADIGGTGTTNTIPRWTGPSTLGDSGLIDDGSVIYTTARNAAFGSTSSAGYRARVLAAAGAGSAFGLRIDAGTNSTDYALRIANQATTSDYLAVRGDGNVGISTASPGTKLDVADTGTPSGTVGIRSLYTGTIAANAGGVLALGGYFTGTSPTTFAYIVGGKDNATAGDFGGHLQFITRPNGGVYTERARIDSAGRLLVGTTGTPSSAAVRVVVAAASGGQQWHSQGLGGCAVVASVNTAQWYVYPGANVGSEGYLTSVKLTETGLDVTTASATPGIKLPATPGNTDPNTLDAYVDGGTAGSGGKTWTIADNSGAGLALTITSCEYIQVGKAITICVDVTFPVTASAANANLSLPVAAKGNWHAGTVAFQSAGAGGLAELTVMCNGAEIAFYAGTTSTRQTNANLSNKRLIFSITYFTAQ